MEPDVDHFDRPRRRDWYWFLGRLGQSLIGLGILMFLFVGYQLWGTGIEESQAQDRLERRFLDYVDTSTVDPPPVATTDSVATAEPVDQLTDDLTDEPADELAQRVVTVNEGDPVAIIDIPDLGVTKYVVAGVAASDLKKGPGHYPSTPQPGHLGNVAIAGHRTTYGEPFRDLDQLEDGDDIVLTDVAGRKFHYRVTDTFVVEPDDSWVVATTDPTRALLTLTTCHPEFSAKQRLVVTAELDTNRSVVVNDEPFRYATDAYVAAPSASTIAGALDSTTTVPDVTASPDTTVPTVSGDGPTTPTSTFEVDTFGEGWFSDTAAWPHVLGWTLVLLLVVFGGWYVARRRASQVSGVAVAILPFFVVLYFVFQNVNRLLPPNL